MNKAIILLSGGIDSTVTLYLAKERGFECHCLIFDYGQRHRREIEAAKTISELAGCPYKVLSLPLLWGGSPLLEKETPIPKNRQLHIMKMSIPSTYVPARNTIFLSFGVSFAEAIGVNFVFMGANYIDYSGYPDCRPEYIDTYNELIRLGTRAGVEGRPIRIRAPLIKKRKVDIVRLGTRLNVPFHLTWSCYGGEDLPCRRCDSCILRAKGFDEAGIKDPLLV